MHRIAMLVGTVSILPLAAALAASPLKPAAGIARTPGPALSVGQAISRGNLSIFPVYSPTGRPSDFLTLDEALQRHLILVQEMPAAEVNRVSVTSKADRPIYLMAGDIILGGKQDREVARDTILPKGARDFIVEVFCVEHGRWEGAAAFTSGDIASGGLRLETQKTREQQKVWARVATEAAALQAATPSGTYRAVAGRSVARTEIEATVKTLGAALARDPRAVGVVAAINGKVTAADLFADRRLFQKELPKILKSYALDAAQQKQIGPPHRPQPTAVEALALLRDANRGELRTTARSATTLNRERETNGTVLFEAAPSAARRFGAGGLGGFGGGSSGPAAHQNIYRKP